MDENSPSPHRRSRPARTASRDSGAPTSGPIAARARCSTGPASASADTRSIPVTTGRSAAPRPASPAMQRSSARTTCAARRLTARPSSETEAQDDVGAVSVLAVVLAREKERGEQLVLDPHPIAAPVRRAPCRAGGQSLLARETAAHLGRRSDRRAGADAEPGHFRLDTEEVPGQELARLAEQHGGRRLLQ